MHARKLIAAAAAAGALALAALPAADAAPKGKSVVIRDNRFAPTSVSVAKGATVTWAWRGKAAHNVHVSSGPARFTSPNKVSGSWSRRLTKKGSYAIVCTIHPGMKMSLTVK
ncbi:plastocyanin/azurin family copper-binding protein [Conexibacter sp. JD483]|uniref:cupredoxin domain-containing protein n=1 Tax=unclassified Conexibacter TaxID=2627773 RepID=UPI00271FD276|nr:MULTISPECIES: plastocyanin/azurin family copper-binding protein [unclassified Conexibacter]MDO8187378.1 plastocyanin/azurin family copper-binding protein [Conexibacter sp. CPCC 205706]MDO8200973.1 plastocyanin/azurin family copper-binding protein [Conexibacter sp. CPCC 205762]MDR9371405.1 plastocyanin/azurin family copper-binding protein [Conexibacter sp. JD483]